MATARQADVSFLANLPEDHELKCSGCSQTPLQRAKRRRNNLPLLSPEMWQTCPAWLDLLFYVFAHCELGAIFMARRVCKSWRERIDSTRKSSVEWELVCQSFVPASAASDPRDFDWKAALIAFSLMRPLFRFPLTFGTDLTSLTGSGRADEADFVRADQLREVLECLERSGEATAIDLRIPFGQILSLRNGSFPKLSALVYKACTQRAPHDHSALVYTWWAGALPRLADRIADRSAPLSAEERRLACDSFDSWVRKIGLALGYLNRYHVTRLRLPRLEDAAAPTQRSLRERLGIE